MDIQLLIPQRDPIIMVDKVISHSKDNTDTLFTINKKNIFVVDNIFQSSGVIEHIAQSAAASMGIETIESGNKPLLGYIASIKNLTIHDLPKVGSVIKTKIIITNQINNIIIVTGVSKVEGKSIASCELRVYIEL